ncbi:hypothetical protein [Paenibacillus sp. MMS18-CY102]|uniref:hypothetical protein n=1 Tax=Paenibacillus sp. MMS18-CY102 TaxID=2682849 RepID=UPI001365E7B8|nr:hypothetical protein [Paenibacillus sp. MMS18-CY102]MWC30360.1 hypothetical protein [Paenibacillus sp. MMS18-CY102]
MKQGLLFAGIVLVLLPSVLTRSGVEMNSFVEGMMMGMGAVGCIAGLLKVKLTGQRA